MSADWMERVGDEVHAAAARLHGIAHDQKELTVLQSSR